MSTILMMPALGDNKITNPSSTCGWYMLGKKSYVLELAAICWAI
jgi:hypothetical protein